jgi:hypothetical protein
MKPLESTWRRNRQNDREAHHLHFVPMGIVPVAEADRAVLGVQEPFVADSDPMGVAPDRRAPARDQRRGAWRRRSSSWPGASRGTPGRPKARRARWSPRSRAVLPRRPVGAPRGISPGTPPESARTGKRTSGVILLLVVRLGQRDRRAESKRAQGNGRRGAIAR